MNNRATNNTIITNTVTSKRGGYSAIIQSNMVDQEEGGQILVDRTVELINSLWPEIK